MYKPSDRALASALASALARALASVPASSLALAAMLTPAIATAGVSTLGPQVTASPKPSQSGAGPWQIRCWQDGRLLFEENGVSLPDHAPYSSVITGDDRQGRPLFVAETRNATCLIRPAVVERQAWPR